MGYLLITKAVQPWVSNFQVETKIAKLVWYIFYEIERFYLGINYTSGIPLKLDWLIISEMFIMSSVKLVFQK